MQAAIQKHIDSSISSTVNLSSDAKIEDVSNIFFLAWRLGCKGITVYREGSREGILITNEQRSTNNQFVQFDRPRVLMGNTIQFKLVEGSLYVTINEDNKGIKEVFVNLGKSGEDEKAYAEAIGRLISLYLQQGGGISETIHTLKGIQGKNTVWSEGMQLLSVPDAVAKALEIFRGKNSQKKNYDNGLKCPECGECTVVAENGCYRCISCLYTKCG
jgi:ribonucleoside-diphosphate reductase alpha chain